MGGLSSCSEGAGLAEKGGVSEESLVRAALNGEREGEGSKQY